MTGHHSAGQNLNAPVKIPMSSRCGITFSTHCAQRCSQNFDAKTDTIDAILYLVTAARQYPAHAWVDMLYQQLHTPNFVQCDTPESVCCEEMLQCRRIGSAETTWLTHRPSWHSSIFQYMYIHIVYNIHILHIVYKIHISYILYNLQGSFLHALLACLHKTDAGSSDPATFVAMFNIALLM